MTDKYETVERIITHQFIQRASFPVQLASASEHQMLFGTVEEDCLLNSFIHLLQFTWDKKKFFAGALQGKQPSPQDAIICVLDDYNAQKIPSPQNLWEIVLKISITEFDHKPFQPLLQIRKCMGPFKKTVSRQMINAVYAMCNPSSTTVINHLHCVPLDAQEEKVLRWLERSLKEADPSTLARFVQFCIAS